MEKFNQLKEVIASTEEEASKFFEKGNKSAGTRLRKQMQAIVGLAKEIRKEVAAVKAEEKAKKASTKEKAAKAKA